MGIVRILFGTVVIPMRTTAATLWTKCLGFLCMLLNVKCRGHFQATSLSNANLREVKGPRGPLGWIRSGPLGDAPQIPMSASWPMGCLPPATGVKKGKFRMFPSRLTFPFTYNPSTPHRLLANSHSFAVLRPTPLQWEFTPCKLLSPLFSFGWVLSTPPALPASTGSGCVT